MGARSTKNSFIKKWAKVATGLNMSVKGTNGCLSAGVLRREAVNSANSTYDHATNEPSWVSRIRLKIEVGIEELLINLGHDAAFGN